MRVLLWFSYLSFLYNVYGIILHTKQGSVKGKLSTSRDGRPFYVFHSIPYAEPPLGELRFKNPIPAKKWDGVKDATVLSPLCIQMFTQGEVIGSEDCLYLNIYTPKVTNNTLMPVMVFIYGGRYMFEHALPSRYGPHYFMDEDVVLITFHYRLGALGFLSTEDEVIPGNYGLKDIVGVLQWIQEYVDSYGGDKNRVTIFGGSSGAAMVAQTLVSPLAKGLFHRAISQSGFPDYTPRGEASRNAWKFASLVGCDDETIISSKALLECLKNVPAETLVANQFKLFRFSILLPTTLWFPVIESEKIPGAFVVDEPIKLMSRKTDIPWIIGMNSDEGAMTAIFIYFNQDLKVNEQLDKDYQKYFPLIFGYIDRFNNSEQVNKITEALKRHYFGDTRILENVHAFSKMVTSLVFLYGIKRHSQKYAGPVYVYCYDHKNQQTFAHTYADFEAEMGVIHGDELISFYNWTEVITPVTEGVDYTVSKQLIKLWTNFAATGNPNGDGEQIWEPVNSSDMNYLHIKNGSLEMKDKFFKSESEFLESIGYL